MADPADDLLPLLGINQGNGQGEESSESDISTSDGEDFDMDFMDDDEAEEDLEIDHHVEASQPGNSARRESQSSQSGRAKKVADKNQNQQVVINFDKSLPGTHAYLGSDLEDLRGRTILEENSIVMLPVLLLPHVILVPGQVIPLQLYENHLVAMVRRVADTNKTFGVLNVRYDQSNFAQITSKIGCTAEIFSMKDDMDEASGISMVRVKARGQQRFKVVEDLISEVTGSMKAKIRILPEVSLSHPLDGAHPPSLRRLLCPSSEDSEDMVKMAVDRQGNVLASVDFRKHRRVNRFYSACLTWWPPWVYKMYDIECLKEQIMIGLSGWCSTRLPSDPIELSYWVAHNLPVDDSTRLTLLSYDSVVQRLRYGLNVIRKSGVHLCCRSCSSEISNKEKVFSMSQEGPLSAFVNPGGYVHEMFTVLAVKNLNHIGRSSTEHTWFPGYAWTIMQCKTCHSHMGWMFTTTKMGLSPHKFWGLCRSSINMTFSERALEEGEDESSLSA